jgi:hypothetical protein
MDRLTADLRGRRNPERGDRVPEDDERDGSHDGSPRPVDHGPARAGSVKVRPRTLEELERSAASSRPCARSWVRVVLRMDSGIVDWRQEDAAGRRAGNDFSDRGNSARCP